MAVKVNSFNSQLVSCRILIMNGGASSEFNAFEEGTAHFVEHMAFTGTTTRTEEDIKVALSESGCTYNAYTSVDKVVYEFSGLAKNFDHDVNIFADMVLNSIFPEQMVERERNIIQEEAAGRLDNNLSHLFGQMNKTVYRDSYLGTNVIGDKDSIDKISRDDLVRFHKSFYIPEEMAIVVSGGVEKAAVKRKLSECFGSKILNKIKKLSREDVYFYGQDIELKKKGLQQSIGIVLAKNNYFAPEKEWVINAILNDMDGMLFERIRTELGLVYSVGYYSTKSAKNSMSVIYFMTKQENLDKTFEALADFINNLDENRVRMAVEKLRSKMLYNYYAEQESRNSQSNSMMIKMISPEYVKPKKMKKLIEQLTAEDVIQYFKDIFKNSYNTAKMTPEVE